jgi:hypothetical protein
MVAAPRSIVVEIADDDLFVSSDGRQLEHPEKLLSGLPEESDAAQFCCKIVEWAQQKAVEHVSESSEDELVDAHGGLNHSLELNLDLLPEADALRADASRQLRIVTWGRSMRRTAPRAQKHFCVSLKKLRYRADPGKETGLSSLIMARVCRCTYFATWVRETIIEIETQNLSDISINCWKGRHRSVAAAELLRMRYYPCAQVQHLEL